MKLTSLSARSLVLSVLLGATTSAGNPLSAAEASTSPCLRIPAGVRASQKVWCKADEIEFSKGVFGRFGLYTDVPPEKISAWIQSQEVDPWLQIYSWDIPKIRTVLSTQDNLVMEWTEDCSYSRERFHLLSFYRMKTKAGESFWFGLHLQSWVGHQKLDKLREAFDRQWHAGHLQFKDVITRPVFDHHEPRFKGATRVKTLDEAISLVLDQLSDEDKAALRGKSWLEQARIAHERGLIQAIRDDFELDSDCGPLAGIRRKPDGAMLPYSWVPDFIFKGVAARNDGRPFVAEDELNNTPLIPPAAPKSSKHP